MSRPKKILLFIDSIDSGGAQRQMVNLGIGLRQKEVELLFVTYNGGSHYKELLLKNNIPYFDIDSRSPLVRVRRLAQICRQHTVTHIVAYLFVPSLIALILRIWRTSLSVMVSERTFEGNVPRFHKVITRKLYPLANVITTNSVSQLKELKLRIRHKNLRVISNSLSPDFFRDKKYNDPVTVILGMGRVSHLKNLHTLIEALSLLKRESIDCKVYWLGDMLEHREYSKQCDELLEANNLSEQWHWMGVQSDIHTYIDEATFLYHGSYGEGFPNVLLEAFGSGLPAVVSKVNDHELIVKDGINGFLFEPDSVESLAESLKKMIGLKQDQLNLFSKACQRTVMNHHTIERVTEKHLELLVGK